MVDESSPSPRVTTVMEDPSVQSVAAVYAEALLNAEGEGSSEDRVAELGELVTDVFDQNPQFEMLLGSPRVSRAEKLSLLERAIFNSASPLLAGFLRILANRDRLELIRTIHGVAVSQLEKLSGKQRVVVKSASPLGDDQINQIQQSLQQKLSAEPVLHVEIDPHLLGGLIIQVGDTVYDSSLRNRLTQLQGRLRQRYVHEIQSGRDRFSHSEGS